MQKQNDPEENKISAKGAGENSNGEVAQGE